MVSEAIKEQILQRKKQLKQKVAGKLLGKAVKNKLSKVPKSTKSAKSEKGREVDAGNLNWKPVEIPDTLDDYEGFYGLEEIDGVDVKIVDGQVKFITKSDSQTITTEEAKEKENALPEGEFEIDPEDIPEEGVEKAETVLEEEEVGPQEESEDLEVEKGDTLLAATDVREKQVAGEQKANPGEVGNKVEVTKKKHIQVTHLIASKDENDEENVPLLPGLPSNDLSEEPIGKEKAVNDDTLKANTFSKAANLELIEDADLPDWSDISLSASTLNGLEKLGFKTPTEIQKRSIPVSLEGKDVIGKAITGSGKTLAYGIPILEKAIADEYKNRLLPEELRKHPTALIFTPTRELANQVMKHLSNLFKYSPFSDKTIISLTGGLSIQKQERLLSYGPRVLVATPGRCLELLEKSTSLAKQIASIDILVLDEADRMLQDGHFEELKKILEILHNYRPKGIQAFQKRWQSLVFSATFSTELFGKLSSHTKKPQSKKRKHDEDSDDAEMKEVLRILGQKLRFRGKPEFVDVNPTEVVANRITEAMIPCAPMERDLMLYYFISIFPGTTLVFTNSIDSVKRLAPMLNNLGVPTVSIHSSMIQKQRLRALERFSRNSEMAKKQGKSSVLIASDVAARGLDIDNIQHVVHYHLPRTADTYVHRSGRTARAGKEGVSIILCSPQEASGPLRKLRMAVTKNEKVRDLKCVPIDTDILDQLKERLDLSAKIAQAEVSSQSSNKEKSWIEKAAEDLGVDDIDDFEDDFLKRDRKRREGKELDRQSLKVYKAQLRDLLKVPIRKSGRRSYIAGGLNNIAKLLLDNEGSDSVMGYLQQDALALLKDKKQKKQKV